MNKKNRIKRSYFHRNWRKFSFLNKLIGVQLSASEYPNAHSRNCYVSVETKSIFMNKTLYFLLLVLLIPKITYGQHEKITEKWKTESISDSNLGDINYHVYKNKIDDRKPLIIYLQGSTNFPLYWLNPNGRYSSSITLNVDSMSNDYHIILISKPNTPLVDSIKVAPSGRKQYPMKEGYSEKYSLDWRANSADKVINDALKKLKIDTSTIIVWGHSEGSQVAPVVALNNKNVTHVISMMGNSLNHLYDFLMKGFLP